MPTQNPLLYSPQQFSQYDCRCFAPSICNTTPLTTSQENDTLVTDRNATTVLDRPTILRDVESGIYGIIFTDGVDSLSQTDPEDQSPKRDAKTPATPHLELRNHDDNNRSTAPMQSSDQVASPALKPQIHDTAEVDSESDRDSGFEFDYYGIGGIDDQAAAKLREIAYRTEFMLPVEQCGSGCCRYSAFGCSDCGSGASDVDAPEVVGGGFGAKYMDVEVGACGYLELV